MLAPIQGQHTNALERAVSSGAPCSTAAPTNQSDRYGGPVRPESSGQPDEDPNAMEAKKEQHVEVALGSVGAGAPWVALGSAGQLEHLQTPWRRRKNSMSRLETLG